MKKKTILAQVRNALAGKADTVGMSKGQIIARRGFYFTHGMTSEKFGAAVLATLLAAKIQGVTFKLVDASEQWKAFNGGHTVAQGSHWAARIEVLPTFSSEETKPTELPEGMLGECDDEEAQS